jgi:hypothetical protein
MKALFGSQTLRLQALLVAARTTRIQSFALWEWSIASHVAALVRATEKNHFRRRTPEQTDLHGIQNPTILTVLMPGWIIRQQPGKEIKKLRQNLKQKKKKKKQLGHVLLPVYSTSSNIRRLADVVRSKAHNVRSDKMLY